MSTKSASSLDPLLTWQPLSFLTTYRLVLSCLLLAIFLFASEKINLGNRHPVLFGFVSLSYLVFAIISLLSTRLRRPNYKFQVFLQVIIDCIAIILLLHASGGQQSGLGFLLIVAVAAGSLLLPGRTAFLFAAIATLTILGEHGFSFLHGYNLKPNELTQSGLLGIALFATAALAHVLAKRAGAIEEIAEQRGADLANLATLNEYIIQQLPSGVIVVDQQQQIRLANQMARNMLAIQHRNQDLQEVAPELAQQLRQWKEDNSIAQQICHIPHSHDQLIPHFILMGNDDDITTLVFLKDAAELAQQSQQIKLAALGQLSASVAHEIRNPLGAISHAGQLLSESDHLDIHDQRLIEIIQTHSKRLNRIVESILQAARSKPSQAQKILLFPWLKDFIKEWQESDPDNDWVANLFFDVEETTVFFDPGQLHQILWNLCQNAQQHGQKNQQQIDLKVTRNNQRQISLEIIDYGQGIAAEDIKHLFEPFFTTSTDGTGLGLYLAREICENNQAQLSYKPNTNGGNCFCIHFMRKIDT